MHQIQDTLLVEAGKVDEEIFTVQILHDNTLTVDKLEVTIHQVQNIEQYTPYEACAPVSSNIYHGDDSHDMPFVPFADDPTFDANKHMLEYEHLAWQDGHVDPDLSAIIIETSRRLHYKHHISIAQIEETEILPRMLCSSSTVWGAIWTDTQNDSLDWPGSSHVLFPALPDYPTPDRNDLRHRLQNYLTLCCPKLSCVQALCSSHNHHQCALNLDETGVLPPHVNDKSSHITCGNDCFVSKSGLLIETQWSLQDCENLRVILQIAPASKPCELAVICQKPCWEVSFPPHSWQLLADDQPSEFTPNEPCTHQGPCDAQCPCSRNKAHCARECRCSKDCSRRWRGCRCTRRKHMRTRACDTDRCPCRRANRECDPELCLSCEIKNSQIQKGRQKRFEVKHSDFGLGVFLMQSAKEGDLIAEYIGELIYEATFDSRGYNSHNSSLQLSNHRGRSYVFGIDPSLSNDSTYAGNTTRFINHAPEKKANCIVGIRIVHGDHRIGIYAKKSLAKGAELFLDYGPEFYF
ncbi:hypothetical protein BKA93DRAFT_742494 [Sparassis latifolia]